ncbi:hypothetical protein BDZ94DRAFT_1244223 [Collybia nuda]|uniref:Uncharacterized protein n=1 Tax=Collybia nuda TaxID=64659 RepID=A0A9P6CR71_9AGAR|nr:hypothetical protein BDZ94DRAFT_1244223 [Collybia nuda]
MPRVKYANDAGIMKNEETGLGLSRFSVFTSKASGLLGASQPAREVKLALER